METNNKLREALVSIKAGILKQRSENVWYITDSDILEKIDAALAEPVKNCEVGTAMEQGERFAEYCDSETCKRNRCKFNAKALCIERCALAWAQMPYEEGGNK